LRSCARPGLPSRPIGFPHPNSKPSGSAVPDPCSASRPSPLRGSRAARASLDSSARLRLSVSMIFAAGRLRSAKTMEAKKPHRNGAVTAERAKRSGAAAQRLDGDGPMWPPTGKRCARAVRTSPAGPSRQFQALGSRGFRSMGTRRQAAMNTELFVDRNIVVRKKRKLC